MTQVAMKKKPRSKSEVLRVPALEVRQGKNRRLYSFAVDGKLLHSFCTVSRISRQTAETLSGYQRPEVASHISQIRDYLESESPLLPNAIVVAFDGTVKFKPVAGAGGSSYSRMGHLEIPIGPFVDDTLKPGWIVDGQQRSAALRDAKVDSFPVCVVGFVTEGFEEQRQQFILVNATKPLPKGLIYELLPSTEGKLPIALQKRRHPAELLERLNFDSDSPLKGLIRTTTNGTGVIADNSILAMLQNSLTDGSLYRLDDIELQLGLLKEFWHAVMETFPDAWGRPPKLSRLMHGAGIVSMGFLMDSISDRHRKRHVLNRRFFQREISLLASDCKWTAGEWLLGPSRRMQWNEIQNLPGHIQLLSNFLLTNYRNKGDSNRPTK
jgi:DGQHR domain-containing protein